MKEKMTASEKKEYWKTLHGKQKVQYVWEYYKFPITVCLIFLYIIGYNIYGHFSKKDIILYTGLVNVSISDQVNRELSDDFLEFMDENISKKDVQLYTGLYLTTDPNNPNYEYTYASRIKILASIDAEQLDVVLMNKEAFDAFSQNGYLYNIEELLKDSAPDMLDELKPYLITNTSILEDNSEEMLADDSLSYEAVTEEFPMGLDVSQRGLFKQAGFEDTVYLGVIANSTHMDMAVEYIKYLNITTLDYGFNIGNIKNEDGYRSYL